MTADASVAEAVIKRGYSERWALGRCAAQPSFSFARRSPEICWRAAQAPAGWRSIRPLETAARAEWQPPLRTMRSSEKAKTADRGLEMGPALRRYIRREIIDRWPTYAGSGFPAGSRRPRLHPGIGARSIDHRGAYRRHGWILNTSNRSLIPRSRS